MKTIIAGSRHITDFRIVRQAIFDSGFHITRVVSGEARGVDLLGEKWALENNIPVDRHPALWEKLGRMAGPVRNQIMVENSDALIAVWDGKTRGTADVIKRAKASGLIFYVHKIL